MPTYAILPPMLGIVWQRLAGRLIGTKPEPNNG
jgi:hypothetical protein